MFEFNEYTGKIGMLLWVAGMIFLVGAQYSQEVLLGKWKAKENKWVTAGYKGFGHRIIKENNPPIEFEEAFNNRVFKKYGWIGYISLFGFFLMIIAGS
ncbi:hypothetical protein HEP89_07180 [Labrenzia sp. 5N]|uniref:hypothetical protein n=1 Tax=unclassified Labrenzia TaxID=2648686 RepID=UPI0012696A32|nr:MULTISPECIES: hypothetical protein [unclassified Labrenzia]MBO9460534.1 hypothetical protein [Labrenzia sp. R5_0]NKX63876.1 hypothetical protein [Labrenzia sp. 5N]